MVDQKSRDARRTRLCPACGFNQKDLRNDSDVSAPNLWERVGTVQVFGIDLGPNWAALSYVAIMTLAAFVFLWFAFRVTLGGEAMANRLFGSFSAGLVLGILLFAVVRFCNKKVTPRMLLKTPEPSQLPATPRSDGLLVRELAMDLRMLRREFSELNDRMRSSAQPVERPAPPVKSAAGPAVSRPGQPDPGPHLAPTAPQTSKETPPSLSLATTNRTDAPLGPIDKLILEFNTELSSPSKGSLGDHLTVGVINQKEVATRGMPPKFEVAGRSGDLLAFQIARLDPDPDMKNYPNHYWIVPSTEAARWNRTRFQNSSWDYFFEANRNQPSNILVYPALVELAGGLWKVIERGKLSVKF